jgi:2',3'-cyclic-nucleotide 2'-phosphodiesterase (5'-nucleotidase family)
LQLINKMKMINKIIPAILLTTAITSCSVYKKSSPTDNGKIDINYVQVNDVYEIAPLAGGKEGGMARVATIKKNYLQQNPNTFLVMAGDFLSPSVYNSLKYEGKAIRGKQMVDVMNAAGTDLVVFGNHEFDIKENELLERLNESNFTWISSNVFHKVKDDIVPFYIKHEKSNTPLPTVYIQHIKDADGTEAKIAYLGLTLPFNKAEYVNYTDVIQTATQYYNQLKYSVDAVVAITHQLVQDDKILAQQLPGLAVIMGGHEHDQRFEKVGKIYITKAMANAKSVFIVKLSINKKRKRTKVNPTIIKIDESIPFDNPTNAVVQKWMNIANNSYASLGFDPQKVVLDKGEPLEGREVEARTHPTNLTRLIVSALKFASPTSDVVIVNSGSIRVDDILQMPVTQYDILRTLPFGGGIREVEMKGSLLIKILNAGERNKGIGGYLLYNEELAFNNSSSNWLLNNQVIDANKIYKVAVTDFLLTGGEANLDFLKQGNPDLIKTDDPEKRSAVQADIRLAIIKYLEQNK